jgi:hypothetical protein
MVWFPFNGYLDLPFKNEEHCIKGGGNVQIPPAPCQGQSRVKFLILC